MSPTSTGLGSDGAGEDESSDTQSTEMGPTIGRFQHQMQDVAFPRDSDRARLENLISGKPAPAMADAKRAADSSSSESEPNTPNMSARSNKSAFTYEDSLRSSGRSASPVSAISSEGRMTMVTERDISDIESLRSARSNPDDSPRVARSRQVDMGPRRLAKTAEQERLESLQEDQAVHSDSGLWFSLTRLFCTLVHLDEFLQICNYCML